MPFGTINYELKVEELCSGWCVFLGTHLSFINKAETQRLPGLRETSGRGGCWWPQWAG